MNFLKLAKQRCSIRSFADKPVEKETLNYILEAARVAPTACNRQPQRIIVVQNPENIKKVAKAYDMFGSSCVLLVCRDDRLALSREFDGKSPGDLDIGIVTDHMMLAARDVGIGSVMVGRFDPEIIRREFNIPDYVEPTALLILGYPEDGFFSDERHQSQRKPINETVMMEEYRELSESKSES